MGPVQIVAMVDGEWMKGAHPANLPRPDVDAAIVDMRLWNLRQGEMRYGFDFTVPAPRGQVTVCVVALNQNLDVAQGIGEHVVLGCPTVSVR